MTYPAEGAYVRSKRPKASKAHHCCECGQGIVPGAVYECRTVFQDHEKPMRFKMCLDCVELARLLGEDLCHLVGLDDAALIAIEDGKHLSIAESYFKRLDRMAGWSQVVNPTP